MNHTPTGSQQALQPKTPSATPTSNSKPAVVIPPPPIESRHVDYVSNEAMPSTTGSASRKRKRDTYLGNVTHTKDQRADADEAVNRLQEMIGDIFEADDDPQSEQSGAQGQQFFSTVTVDEKETRTLESTAIGNLDSLLSKVVGVDRLEDIPSEDLHRLQVLCTAAVSYADEADLQIDDLDNSIPGLEAVDHGLRSARSILRIMAAGREDKKLYPEELLQSIVRLIQKAVNCLASVIEARSSGPEEALFASATSHRKLLTQLLNNANKDITLITQVAGKEEMAETVVTPLEFCAIGLLFVEYAPSEKESVLGIPKVENLRRSALDAITTIYSRYPSQRDFLFTEILTSLQKLPTGRQAKRNLKLRDGKAIQVVSALIMELVQTIATASTSFKKLSQSSRKILEGYMSDDDQKHKAAGYSKETGAPDDDDDGQSDYASDEDNHDSDVAMQRMSKQATSLCNAAGRSAQYAAFYLVNRAQTAFKTGDQPHRQLLDIFVEDLLEVLGMPEWPGAELLLRALFRSFSNIIKDPKSTAPAKNMALELLGNIGSSISELVSKTQRATKSLESHGSALDESLSQMLSDYLEGSLELGDIVQWNGPYHAVVDYLTPHGPRDLHNTGAQGYYLAQWAKSLSTANTQGPESALWATRLHQMLRKVDFFPLDAYETISDAQAQVAYALTVLNMDLCRQFDFILGTLLKSINTEQPTVRSRALKSVTQMLEKDPSLLDRSRDIKLSISQCTTDVSSMVRDSALTLITKCISLKPVLEAEFLPKILVLVDDAAVSVRKRTIKLLKDIYLRNDNKDVKAAIACNILQRVQDNDAAVAELSQQTLEEIWMTPYWSLPELKDATASSKIALREQFSLVVRTIEHGEKTDVALEMFLRQILAENSKFTGSDARVCKSLLASGFEALLETTEQRKEQETILLTMTIFAQAKPDLFSPDQVQMLQPYISNLKSTEELNLVRYIAVIFRCVLPALPAIQHELLRSIQGSLLGSIQKLDKPELNEVAHCLRKINDTLKNPEKLMNLTKQVLEKLYQMRNMQFGDPAQQDHYKRAKRYIWIAGAVGRYCDFEPYRKYVQTLLPWWKPDEDPSVAGLIVQCIKPFSNASQPVFVRAEALGSIGNVCQAWPRQFTKKHISSAFENVLQKGEPDLKLVVISNFRDFLQKIETQASTKAGGSKPVAENEKAPIKLGASATASDDDGASTLIAQYFLKDILKVALASQDAPALAATEVIASINRQGLAHPRSSGSALVALETSENKAIAKVAIEAHRILHQQHESALEQDYMRAIQDAFRYQRDVAHNCFGYTTNPPEAKLQGLWEIIRTSVGKYQKKFLSNFCARIDFDLAKIDVSGNPPRTLQYSRFLTENLALFEYPRLDELVHVISCMEKIVANTGSGLAHSITTEVFYIVVEADAPADTNGAPAQPEPVVPSSSTTDAADGASSPSVDPARLYLLTTASIILSVLWEARTYLRRSYGQNASQQKREANKGKAGAKDMSKAPTRIPGVSSDKFIAGVASKVASLDSRDGMLSQCQKFVDLMKIDDEVKVTADSEEGSYDRPETPAPDDEDERDTPMSGSSRGFKRKGSFSAAGTPGKRKKARPPLKRSRSGRKSVDGDEDADGDWV